MADLIAEVVGDLVAAFLPGWALAILGGGLVVTLIVWAING